ncbi:Bifunctional enzyme IspD/IspF (Includes: 2-C-methyl-D-erythritol 4-phosphate cytidylyltransferase; 2-C-methyl-D-erythritol 2,4-cyclodiphosphate synthase) [Rhodospirillaceae bacterium LM-1]|nr:Bifunctional enzyme IspD/IspF (Includes: 2-C-methyl-D-erythritol 4-phosphate cytidylyltransferase; 2-C-methyl-D-erythritol 2,4-cyclodiphosphate synthase) [Rhodospirillaceae bacterium LM-1]
MVSCVALIVAAGRGHRFGAELPKQYLELGGRMVLSHSLAAFATHPEITGVRAVIHQDDRLLYDLAARGLRLLDPVPGGAARQDSVRLGLESLQDNPPDYVLIHDGARPFIEAGVISRAIAALKDHAGAIPAIPVADTLKRAEAGMISGTQDRANLWRAQTPQAFRYKDILAAHRAMAGKELTDDAAVLEAHGLPVALTEGCVNNVKITTKRDLELAAKAFERPLMARTGNGFDVHRFKEGSDHVWLNGVKVPHSHGLEGHSDADVALHALTDALLGAIGAGDIGHHFPPSDPQWKGAASDKFLAHAASLTAAKGGRIVNVDVTIICERPKVGPHRPAMIARLAEILGIDQGRISVKATTTEGLGFTGRQEGIAAMATATVAMRD